MSFIRILIVFTTVLLFPSLSLAQKIAIVPVEYGQVENDGQLVDAAKQIEDKITEAAVVSGFEVMRGKPVETAIESIVEPSKKCDDKSCLETLAKTLAVDEVIFLSAMDDDHTMYAVKIVFAHREGIEEEKTAGFFVVLEWIRGTVALLLQNEPIESAELSSSANTEENKTASVDNVADSNLDSERTTKEEMLDVTDTKTKTKLNPKWFWLSASITGALAIGYGITDVIVHSKYRKLRDSRDSATISDSQLESDRDKAKKIQVFDRVLLGLTVAGAVTSTVLFFMTDFKMADAEKDTKDNNQSKVSHSFFAAPISNGAMLGCSGHF